MPKSQMEIRSIMKEPSALAPIVMSVIALALVMAKVLGDLATHGAVVHEADEGTLAHIWQLLMVGQVPLLAFFAIAWLPLAPGQTLFVLSLQPFSFSVCEPRETL